MVATRSMRSRAASGGCADLSSDGWQVVAECLHGGEGDTWRGMLRCVCRAARDGVDLAVAAPTANHARVLDPRVLTSRVQLLQWAVDQGCRWVDDLWVRLAAEEHTSVRVLQWGAQSRGWALRLLDVCEMATLAGDVAVLQWARDAWLSEQSRRLNKDTCRLAAAAGQLATLQWARAQGCPWDETTCHKAAGGGHLELLRWALEHGCPFGADAWSLAAAGGHLHVLQWLLEQGYEMGGVTTSPWAEAAQQGRIAVLQWAVEHGFELHHDTCTFAAANGQLEVLQWLRQRDFDWDAATCSAAARHGRLEVLQWVRERGCPWDKETCSEASCAGNLEVLQWARGQGCPWDAEKCLELAEGFHRFDVAEWILYYSMGN
eukprot:jgi/Tetstr1/458859/TSEL_004368.t1